MTLPLPAFKKPKRSVTRTFLHCSASSNPKHNDVSVMRSWHLARGWNDVGYHFFITTQGQVQLGRPLEKVPAAQDPHNTGTIAICLHGLEVRDFTMAQFDALRALVAQIDGMYNGNMTYHGHCEVSSKLCPVFDYKAVLGLDSKGNLGGGYTVPRSAGPVIQAATDGATPNLAIGLQDNPYVKEVQTILKMRTLDGDFGPLTEQAVKKFQTEHDLLPHGVVDAATWAALRAKK